MKSITSKGLVPQINRQPKARITAGLQEIARVKAAMTIIVRKMDEAEGRARRQAALALQLEELETKLLS